MLIAGGIGSTPISAMARHAREQGIEYQIHYSGRSRASMAFIDDLSALHGERLRLYVSEEGARNDFSALRIEEDTQVYACGPARMMEALSAQAPGGPKAR